MQNLGRKNSRLFELVTGKEADLLFYDESVNFYHDNVKKHGEFLPIRLIQVSKNKRIDWGFWNARRYYPELGEELHMVDNTGKGVTFRITSVDRIDEPVGCWYSCEMLQIVPPENE